MKNEGFRTQQEQLSSHFVAGAYERAISGRGQEQIDMDDFIEHYGLAVVTRDKERINEIQRRIALESTPEDIENKKLATILEAILIEQIELSDWFGGTTQTYRTSPFDDIRNGVDAVVDIERERSSNYFALAVDVTYGSMLKKKFDRIQDEIERGTLATIKYFKDADDTFTGRLSKIPRVVLGIDKARLMTLAELWVKNKKKELAVHPVQFELLEEIRIQLVEFKRYALSLPNKESLVKIYERQLAVINTILKERREAFAANGHADDIPENDTTFNAISDWARHIGSLAIKPR